MNSRAIQMIHGVRTRFERDIVTIQSGHIGGADDTEAASVQDMRVNHGCIDMGVPEQFLDGSNVVAAFEQVRGEGMSTMS